MEKIEFIEVNGKQLPLSIFPETVTQQVNTYEIVRDQYNASAVNTQALSEYMQRLGATIQQLAHEHVAALTAPAVVPDAVEPEVVEGDLVEPESGQE